MITGTEEVNKQAGKERRGRGGRMEGGRGGGRRVWAGMREKGGGGGRKRWEEE